jgi:hypothetical protein
MITTGTISIQNSIIPKEKYIIFTQRLAGYLLMNHFNLLSVRPDIKNPLSKVYIFEQTPELLEAIEDYKLQYSNK